MAHAAVVAKRRQFTTQRLYTTCFFFGLMALHYIGTRSLGATRRDALVLGERADEDCRMVHEAPDKCAFVKINCRDDEAGLLQYLSFYYCTFGTAQEVAFVVLIVWLVLLFTTIGIAASDFFSVNLSTIATILGLSESLAGVTFLAFGNGSPDVFSTFAAMGSNSGGMAVGELIGAAGFITAVVAGSMALVREFKVSKKTFVRDVCFFIVAVGFTVYFLSDGHIHLWECCLMIGFYVFYVIVVVGWHAFVKRRKSRRMKEIASRGDFFTSGHGQGNEELEPLTGGEEDLDTTPGAPRDEPMDITMLERGPRIEVDDASDDDSDDDDSQGRHITAEMTSSMRLMRPRGRRSHTTITPIRPSLIGALEFRSILASLQEERNMRLAPIHVRSHSEDAFRSGWTEGGGAAVRGIGSPQTVQATGNAAITQRSRAVSSGAIPPNLDKDLARPTDLSSQDTRQHTHSSTPVLGGKLAPPTADTPGGYFPDVQDIGNMGQTTMPGSLQLRIPSPSPSPHGSGRSSSPSMQAFPSYTDSPQLYPPSPGPRSPAPLPTPALDLGPQFPAADKPVRWWPYRFLPAPHILQNTFFPTLRGWESKSGWDKFVSLISVPSIFLLVATLPVVESETTDDESEANIVEQPASGHPTDHAAAAVSYESQASLEPETEWQRYRRRTRSRSGSELRSSVLISLEGPDEARDESETSTTTETVRPALVAPDAQHIRPVSEAGFDASTIASDDQGWNRWLLLLQVFTGPLFVVFIVWANMVEDMERPLTTLGKAVSLSVVGSLAVLLIILFTTTPERRPKYHYVFCFMGFVISIAWISTVAGEVVGVLKAFGVILDISEAILGLTVFAVGNSIGDLVADVTVARLGYPVMALSACFGGPLLNILLGIGLGGAYQTVQAANKKQEKHPGQPVKYKPYKIQVGATLLVSAIVLLITLLALLVALPMNRWVMSRRIGWGLITLWGIGTVVNLVIEITGVWRDIA